MIAKATFVVILSMVPIVVQAFNGMTRVVNREDQVIVVFLLSQNNPTRSLRVLARQAMLFFYAYEANTNSRRKYAIYARTFKLKDVYDGGFGYYKCCPRSWGQSVLRGNEICTHPITTQPLVIPKFDKWKGYKRIGRIKNDYRNKRR